MLRPGIYEAERTGPDWMDYYHIRIEVKETEKSYIFRLIEFDSRYGAAHIEHLFGKSDKVVMRKEKSGHAIRVWNDRAFTLYPFRAGIPYYFKKEEK